MEKEKFKKRLNKWFLNDLKELAKLLELSSSGTKVKIF